MQKCFPLKGKQSKESGLGNLGWTVESEVVCLGIEPVKTCAHLLLSAVCVACGTSADMDKVASMQHHSQIGCTYPTVTCTWIKSAFKCACK